MEKPLPPTALQGEVGVDAAAFHLQFECLSLPKKDASANVVDQGGAEAEEWGICDRIASRAKLSTAM